MKKLLITVGVVAFVVMSIVGYGFSACEGDINCSGTVDGSDLALFAADFGTTGCGTCDDVITRLDELEARIEYLELYHPDRFTDMGDGTIRDNNTGLFWMKLASSCTMGGPSGIYWLIAMEIVDEIADGECRLSDGSKPGDWRLPSASEFTALVNTEWASVGPALSDRRGMRAWQDGDAFSGVQEAYYWTRSVVAGNDRYVMDMDTGYLVEQNRDMQHFLWPVRDELP